MSKCSFSIPFSESAEDFLVKAKSGITSAGGIFFGDVNAGNFSISTFVGAIAGTYTFRGSTLQVEITDKPMFLSCSMIEEELRKKL